MRTSDARFERFLDRRKRCRVAFERA